MKEITLTQHKNVLVDDEDYEWLIKYHWCLVKCGSGHYYARRYEYVEGKNKAISMHTMIFPDAPRVDHIDNNGLNNQRNNLRPCSHSDNMKNRKIRGTSKYRGVSRHMGKCWLAKININGKQKHLGVFQEEKEAAIAYNNAVISTGNPFYVMNNI